MKKSYLLDYIKTYFWQGFSVITSMLAMLIVIPAISDNQVVYGVYSVCISTAIFLKYADIGFVSAGYKYAGESFARADKAEAKIFGFTSFILFIFVTIIIIGYLFFSYEPQLLIKDLSSGSNLKIASQLLLIQALFSYNVVFRRLINGIFSIRIEIYKFQRLTIIGSFVTLISVFYFFAPGKYDIVGYFLFLKITDFVLNIIGLVLIKKRYKYSYLALLKAFKFDKEVYNKVKKLAYNSLFVTVMWILYYEIDIVVIGNTLGATSVAVFSVAFAFIRFFRSLFSILFAPFQARYNHFVGLKDYEGLKVILFKVIRYTMPIIVFIILSVIILSKNILLTWVGKDYSDSVIILILLSVNAMYSFIVIPTSEILKALEKIKSLYLISATQVIVYWAGIAFTLNWLGIVSFPLFKLVSGTVILVISLTLLIKVLQIDIFTFIKQTIFQIAFPALVQALFLILMLNYLPLTENRWNLILVIITGGISVAIGFVTIYFTSSDFKIEIKHYISRLIPN